MRRVRTRRRITIAPHASPHDATLTRQSRRSSPIPGLQVLVELTKARLVTLVVVTAGVGFALAGGAVSALLAWAMLGTALAAAGSMALNEWQEAHLDARMERTCRRPLPAGELAPGLALAVGLGLAAAGVAVLATLVNLLTAALGLAVVLLYTLIYTPLKVRSPLATLVGAVCGALPPMMGWAAVVNDVGLGAWILAGVLFLWQIPHFLALAWLYREDYARGGFRLLPLVDRRGDVTALMVVLYALALVPVSLSAALAGLAGNAYAAGALVLGGGLVVSSVTLARSRADADARRLFVATLLYLPLLLGLLAFDRTPREAPRLEARAATASLVEQ